MKKKILKFLLLFLIFILIFSFPVSAAEDWTDADYLLRFYNTLPLEPSMSFLKGTVFDGYSHEDIISVATDKLVSVHGAIDISGHDVYAFMNYSGTSINVYFVDNDFISDYSGVFHAATSSVASRVSIKATIDRWYSSSDNSIYTKTYYSAFVNVSDIGMLQCLDCSTSNSDFSFPISFQNITSSAPIDTGKDDALTLSHYPLFCIGDSPEVDGFYLFADSGLSDSGSDSGEDIPYPDTGDDITDSNFSGLLKGLVDYFNQFLGRLKGYISDVGSKVSSGFGSVSSSLDNIVSWLSSIHTKIGTSIRDFKDSVVDLISDLSASISSLWEKYLGHFSEIIEAIWNLGTEYGTFDFSIFTFLLRIYNDLFFPSSDSIIGPIDHIIVYDFAWVYELDNSLILFRDTIIDCIENPEPPVIVIPLSNIGKSEVLVSSSSSSDSTIVSTGTSSFVSSLSSVHFEDIVWDFEWYRPYKPLADAVIAGFIYLAFFWRFITSIPAIIQGQASPFVSDIYRNSVALDKNLSKKAAAQKGKGR